MRRAPTDKELRTFYAGVRHGDSLDQVRRILGVSKSQLSYWKRLGKTARKKKRKDYNITDEEDLCLELLKLIRAANRRKRGWTNE